ncbi:hypothetical protein F8V45_22910 [Salmonella enterica]|nr:hypothetical protein [Salmonella enterica]
MNTLTKEEVQAISDLKAGYALGHADVAILQNLTHMLLASLNATPIYQVQYGQKWRDVTKERYEDHRDHGSSTRIVYAEPPAPVGLVNDAYLESLIKYQEAELKAAEYELKKNATQAMDYSADREMLKRLAVIMCGNDSPGEIRSLTVTAQSLVDRCKALARDKEALPSDIYTLWRPASPDEINKRSIRESTNIDSPSREAIVVDGVLVECPRCHGDAYRLRFNGWNYYRCDKCANAITSEGK